MGFGRHPIPVPAAGGTYDPLHPPVMEVLGGDVPVPPSVSAATVPTPASANHGAHIVHFGGANDSWLANSNFEDFKLLAASSELEALELSIPSFPAESNEPERWSCFHF